MVSQKDINTIESLLADKLKTLGQKLHNYAVYSIGDALLIMSVYKESDSFIESNKSTFYDVLKESGCTEEQIRQIEFLKDYKPSTT